MYFRRLGLLLIQLTRTVYEERLTDPLPVLTHPLAPLTQDRTMTTDPTLKPCTSCVHCHGYNGTPSRFELDDMFLECKRYPVERVNYVNGTRWNDYLLCLIQRKSDGDCGPEGRGFEQKPEPPNSDSAQWSLRRWLGLK